MNPRQKIDRCIFYIEEHLWEPLSTAEVEAQAGYNPRYFCRVFKRSRGLSPGEWVRRRRLERVVDKLCTGMSVTEAAQMCGYETSSGFNKAFRKRYGLSPTQYIRSADPAPDPHGGDQG